MNNFFQLLSNNQQNIGNLMTAVTPKNDATNKPMMKVDKLNQINNQLANVALSSGNPYAMAAGIGAKALGLANSFVNKKGRDEFGIYKNNFSKIADVATTPTYLLPFKLMNMRKEQKQAKESKNLFLNTQNLNVQKKAGQSMFDSQKVFSSYQDGGVIKKDCGCNKKDDGIDTDVLFKLNDKEMSILNKMLKLPESTKYDNENVKPKLKEFAKNQNMRLIDFLYSNPELKQALEKVSIKKQGGWIQKAVNKEHLGFCTPLSKPTCTPHRKALARRFKSGEFRKK